MNSKYHFFSSSSSNSPSEGLKTEVHTNEPGGKPVVVLAAGGKGTRIQSLNSSVPKPMIPIAGKPILEWGIESLVRWGYTDIIITVSHLKEAIIDYFGDGSGTSPTTGKPFGASITYYEESTPLGNAGAIFKLWSEGRLTDTFLNLISDAIYDVDFDRFLSYHYSRSHAHSNLHASLASAVGEVEEKRKGAEGKGAEENGTGQDEEKRVEKPPLATLFCHPNNHMFDSTVAVINEVGVVTAWLGRDEERPEWYKNNINAGLQILTTELLALSGIDPATVGKPLPSSGSSVSSSQDGRGDKDSESGKEGEPGKILKVDLDKDVIKPAISSGRIYAYSSPEYCKDCGTPERFAKVEKDIQLHIPQLKNLRNKQKAIFLDRDGTINKYVGFLRDIEQFELINGVAEAIRLINESGYLAIVITNQPVIARGEVTTPQLDLIHAKMETLLGQKGAYLDDTLCCIHHPDRGYEGEIPELKIDCNCRKPKPGLVLQAAHDYNIDLSRSFFIGDSWRDVQTGQNAGTSTILLKGKDGESTGLSTTLHPVSPDYECNDLLTAVKMILSL